MKLGKTLYVKRRREWRAWLAKHHRTAPEIWLIYYKKHSGKPRIPYNDAVEEALCYGWIDSITKTVDGDRWAQRFSPRRPTSRLSAMNRERVRRLIASGRMTKAGLQRIEHVFDQRSAAKQQRDWEMPKDILRRLMRDPATWKNFRRFPQSYKRIRVGWIAAARAPAGRLQAATRVLPQDDRAEPAVRYGAVTLRPTGFTDTSPDP